ncbi:MAG: hypothetical protein U0798_09360 [Gemmataceae bacterium]
MRAFVVRDRIVGSMKRVNPTQPDECGRGGTAERYELSVDQRTLALKACRATGAIYAGVDLMVNDAGEWTVIEVNAVPARRHWHRSAKSTSPAVILSELLAR